MTNIMKLLSFWIKWEYTYPAPPQRFSEAKHSFLFFFPQKI